MKESTSCSRTREGHGTSIVRNTLFLDKGGEVDATLHSDGLTWEYLDEYVKNQSTCLGFRVLAGVVTEISFCDVYSVKFMDNGVINGSHHETHNVEMHWFMLNYAQKSRSQPGVLVPTSLVFGHTDLQTCQLWVDRIRSSLELQCRRPKNLMVFINPKSGKAKGCSTWEKVSPIFLQAKVKTKVIITQRAGQAGDVMASTLNDELSSYDGFVSVGGDGFFNELLNGFLLSRHKAPYPSCPSDISTSDHDGNALEFTEQNGGYPCEKFQFGIIPAGSTDSVVMCTTGTRDPLTCALHIVLGKRIRLDLARIVRWKATSTSETKPFVRYAASFAGYGFYGDVILESEKCRWMGPKRYDFAGTKVFMKHRSYEAEISYMETESKTTTNSNSEKVAQPSRLRGTSAADKPERIICRANCVVCNETPSPPSASGIAHFSPNSNKEPKWRNCRGKFLSVGAAVISNRNDRAPDGLVADAHLADGYLHLLLIRDCPRAEYLLHLTHLARRGGEPWNFDFVEHHKTSAFTFTSIGEEGVWNVDGELFRGHRLAAEVFRGLITLFAPGPEV